jgi:hypothetical protein
MDQASDLPFQFIPPRDSAEIPLLPQNPHEKGQETGATQP